MKKPKDKKLKVLVAMSGGVDSSVAALLMLRKGYEVVGAFMKNYSDSKNEFGECNWREERKMAIKIASKLNIKLITLDFEKQYKKQVVEKMFENYKQGITPNPDIDCNQKIKFPLLIKEAKKIGADFIVTGHYAKIKPPAEKENPKNKRDYKLLRAKDESKDQSYFLYRLNQKELSKTIFPIGNYTKKQIRKIAEENNFPNYNKKGTVGICFIGKINLKEFLSKKIKPKKGKILDPDGNNIGEHDGIYYYTIGQRLGPRYGFEVKRETKVRDKKNKEQIKRWYVAKKDKKTNTLIAAPEEHPILYRKEIYFNNAHWISKNPPTKNNRPKKIHTRIRQVGELISSKFIYDNRKKKFKIILKKPITGISEGQAAVIYKGKETLGGGVISFS